MRTTTIITSAGGALLAAAVLAVTLTAPGPSNGLSNGPSNDASAQPMMRTASSQLVAASTAPRPAPAPLTEAQMALVEQYLGAHPGRALRLAATAARWKAFADANPELAAELAKVAAMAPADRRAELRAWFADHPGQKAAFQAWVKQTRQDRVERRSERRELRQDRRERRQERRENRNGAATSVPSTTTSGAALVIPA
jgi:hypothetical protein